MGIDANFSCPSFSPPGSTLKNLSMKLTNEGWGRVVSLNAFAIPNIM